MSSLEELFCHVDDFCQAFEPVWHRQLLTHNLKTRRRRRFSFREALPTLSLSEIMTILIRFHQSHYRNFKAYYIHHVCKYWEEAFPDLVSYNRFVEWTPSCLFPLCCYLKTCFGTCTGISFIDATSLKVCHNRRIWQHKVCKDTAARGKTSVGWLGTNLRRDSMSHKDLGFNVYRAMLHRFQSLDNHPKMSRFTLIPVDCLP